jgi:hypothetical protein
MNDEWVKEECRRIAEFREDLDSTGMGGRTPFPAAQVSGAECIVCGKMLTGSSPAESPLNGTAFAGRPGYGSRFDSLSEPESMMLVVVVCDGCLAQNRERVFYRETVHKEAHIVSKFLP